MPWEGECSVTEERLQFVAHRLAGESITELCGSSEFLARPVERFSTATSHAGQGLTEFLPSNRRYCYPLTVTDHASRFLLTCGALSSIREDYASPC
jgi:hypothetical protein